MYVILFPLKNKKKKKQTAVLAHKAQLRCEIRGNSQVEGMEMESKLMENSIKYLIGDLYELSNEDNDNQGGDKNVLADVIKHVSKPN